MHIPRWDGKLQGTRRGTDGDQQQQQEKNERTPESGKVRRSGNGTERRTPQHISIGPPSSFGFGFDFRLRLRERERGKVRRRGRTPGNKVGRVTYGNLWCGAGERERRGARRTHLRRSHITRCGVYQAGVFSSPPRCTRRTQYGTPEDLGEKTDLFLCVGIRGGVLGGGYGASAWGA
ncbi:hypothetical protein BKA93DRAFT_813203 [Sparassis latifolia]